MVNIVNLAAYAARPTTGQAPKKLVVVHPEVDDDGLTETFALEDAVKLLGLRQRPRKPIEHKPFGRVRLRQTLFDHPHHQIVRHEVAALHNRPDDLRRAACRG